MLPTPSEAGVSKRTTRRRNSAADATEVANKETKTRRRSKSMEIQRGPFTLSTRKRSEERKQWEQNRVWNWARRNLASNSTRGRGREGLYARWKRAEDIQPTPHSKEFGRQDPVTDYFSRAIHTTPHSLFAQSLRPSQNDFKGHLRPGLTNTVLDEIAYSAHQKIFGDTAETRLIQEAAEKGELEYTNPDERSFQHSYERGSLQSNMERFYFDGYPAEPMAFIEERQKAIRKLQRTMHLRPSWNPSTYIPPASHASSAGSLRTSLNDLTSKKITTEEGSYAAQFASKSQECRKSTCFGVEQKLSGAEIDFNHLRYHLNPPGIISPVKYAENSESNTTTDQPKTGLKLRDLVTNGAEVNVRKQADEEQRQQSFGSIQSDHYNTSSRYRPQSAVSFGVNRLSIPAANSRPDNLAQQSHTRHTEHYPTDQSEPNTVHNYRKRASRGAPSHLENIDTSLDADKYQHHYNQSPMSSSVASEPNAHPRHGDVDNPKEVEEQVQYGRHQENVSKKSSMVGGLPSKEVMRILNEKIMDQKPSTPEGEQSPRTESALRDRVRIVKCLRQVTKKMQGTELVRLCEEWFSEQCPDVNLQDVERLLVRPEQLNSIIRQKLKQTGKIFREDDVRNLSRYFDVSESGYVDVYVLGLAVSAFED